MNRKGKHNDSTLALVAERRAQAVLLRELGLELKQIAAILSYDSHTTIVYFNQTHDAEFITNPVYTSIYTELSKIIRVENLT